MGRPPCNECVHFTDFNPEGVYDGQCTRAAQTVRVDRRSVGGCPRFFQRGESPFDEVSRLRARLAEHDADMEAVAGEFLVALPEPGTDGAKLMRANRLLRHERDALRTWVDDVETLTEGAINLLHAGRIAFALDTLSEIVALIGATAPKGLEDAVPRTTNENSKGAQ